MSNITASYGQCRLRPGCTKYSLIFDLPCPLFIEALSCKDDIVQGSKGQLKMYYTYNQGIESVRIGYHLSLFLSVSVCLSVFLSAFLSRSLSLSVCLSVSFSLSLSLYRSFSVSQSLIFTLFLLFLFLRLCLSLCVFLSVCIHLSLSLSLSLSQLFANLRQLSFDPHLIKALTIVPRSSSEQDTSNSPGQVSLKFRDEIY